MTNRHQGRDSTDAAPPDRRAGGLEAPHRRQSGGFRPLERFAVRAYRAASWLIAHVPPRPAWTVIGWFSQAGYLLWPTKRHWVDANFGHVLRRDPADPAVRRLALRAYRHYARYLVELMRLPRMEATEVARLIDPQGLDEVEQIWRESDGLILAVGHIGNNEACAAGVASRGWPVSVVADDSTFPEMFELLRRQRERWSVTIIPWRNLRAVYAVLRRKEILGLLIDWGYRSDGIPVRLFGSWTTLPAGPVTLAARTGATILPVTIRRREDDRLAATIGQPIRIASATPADLQRATQAMADALEGAIAAAPDQWYSFKPMWPATDEEAESLAARAAAMLAGAADATSAVGATSPTVARRDRPSSGPAGADRPASDVAAPDVAPPDLAPPDLASAG